MRWYGLAVFAVMYVVGMLTARIDMRNSKISCSATLDSIIWLFPKYFILSLSNWKGFWSLCARLLMQTCSSSRQFRLKLLAGKLSCTLLKRSSQDSWLEILEQEYLAVSPKKWKLRRHFPSFEMFQWEMEWNRPLLSIGTPVMLVLAKIQFWKAKWWW